MDGYIIHTEVSRNYKTIYLSWVQINFFQLFLLHYAIKGLAFS